MVISNSNSRLMFLAQWAGFGATIFIQIGALLIWGAKLDARMTSVEILVTNQEKTLAAMDANGSRRLPLLEDRQVVMQKQVNETNKKVDEILKELTQHLIDNGSNKIK